MQFKTEKIFFITIFQPSIASPILNPADFPRFLFTIGEKKTPSLSCYSEDDDDDDKWLVAVPTKWMSIKRD